MKKSKHFVAGILVGATLFGGTAVFAAGTAKIDVVVQNLKYYFDGLEKKPSADQQGFIYKGTTYVPLRFVSEALGKKVGWEGKTNSIYVGKQPEGKVIYLTELQPHSTSGYYNNFSDGEVTTNMNESFSNSFLDDIYSGGVHSADYIINSEYKSFKAGLAPDIHWQGKDSYKLGSVKIYGDGELLYTSPDIISDATAIENIELDVTGVNRLRIAFTNSSNYPYLDFIQPRFIQ
ncbi:stalk domain-containing protein [Paenibacillus sp. SN-8-1]|uniref:stalk domain-containing protein n=1 Tax=Paenibacillus sp. SN-8-1 TaxID=3435409 RepID=UPI003D9A5A52